MPQPISLRSRIAAFMAGALFGPLLYASYLWLGLDGALYPWLAGDGMFATTFGSVFFPVQYVIFSFGDYWTFSDATTITVCFFLAAVLYGYIFLSFRLFPKTAIGTFVASVIVFLFSLVVFWNSDNPILGLLFWPVAKFNEFAMAAQLPAGAVLVAADCCLLGLWYSALICGLCTLVRYPKSTPTAEDRAGEANSSAFGCPKDTFNDKLVPGWYVGTCSNTTIGISANLLLVIHGVNASEIFGDLYLAGELGGGGAFHGKINGELTFSTCIPGDQIVIAWRAHVRQGQVSGSYSASTTLADLVAAGQQLQQGTWACRLVRHAGPPNPSEMDSVYVHNEGSKQGPFSRAEFDRLVVQNRWPSKAIVAMEDSTVWSMLGDYLASGLSQRN